MDNPRKQENQTDQINESRLARIAYHTTAVPVLGLVLFFIFGMSALLRVGIKGQTGLYTLEKGFWRLLRVTCYCVAGFIIGWSIPVWDVRQNDVRPDDKEKTYSMGYARRAFEFRWPPRLIRFGQWTSHFQNGKKQNEVSYSNDLKEGLYTGWDKFGDLAEQGRYIHNQKEGLWTSWWALAKVGETVYVKGEENGNYVNYYYNGRIREKSEPVDFHVNKELKKGRKTTEYDTMGNILNEGVMIGNQKVGRWKESYPNFAFSAFNDIVSHSVSTTLFGGKNDEFNNAEGEYELISANNISVPVGKWIIWVPNVSDPRDIIKAEVIFDDAQKNGRYYSFKLFSSDGALVVEGQVKNGQRAGLWKEWHKNGVLKSSEKCTNTGKRIGAHLEWYQNGVLASECNDLSSKEWCDDGQIKSEGDQNGHFVEWFQNGAIKKDINSKSKNKTEIIEERYSNGMIKKKFIFVDNGKNKLITDFNRNGDINSAKLELNQDAIKYDITVSGSINIDHGTAIYYTTEDFPIDVINDGWFSLLMVPNLRLDYERIFDLGLNWNKAWGFNDCLADYTHERTIVDKESDGWDSTKITDHISINNNYYKSETLSLNGSDIYTAIFDIQGRKMLTFTKDSWWHYYPGGKNSLEKKVSSRTGAYNIYGEKWYMKSYHPNRNETVALNFSVIKHGIWSEWHENGQKSCEGTMLDGKQYGEWVYWNKAGQVSSNKTFYKQSFGDTDFLTTSDSDATFTDGVKTIESKSWVDVIVNNTYFKEFNTTRHLYKNGQTALIFSTGKLSYEWGYIGYKEDNIFKNHLSVDKRISYSPDGKESYTIVYMIPGVTSYSGMWKEWHSNGQLKIEGEYLKGQKVGVWKSWYEDGKIESERGNGKAICWYNNGKMKNERSCIEGKYLDKGWSENGVHERIFEYYCSLDNIYEDVAVRTIVEKLDYQDVNQKHITYDGKYMFYNKNTNVKIEANYVNGYQNGKWVLSVVDDKILEETYFQHGVKHGAHYSFNPQDMLSAKGQYEQDRESGVWTWYFANKQKAMEGTYKDGIRVGEWTSWSPDAKEIITIDFTQGKANGVWKEWYGNGNLRLVDEYLNGDKNGAFKTWYLNGTPESFGQCKNDQPDGQWQFWYDNGIKRCEYVYRDGKLNGPCAMWYDNGRLINKCEYSNDRIAKRGDVYNLQGEIIVVPEEYDKDR